MPALSTTARHACYVELGNALPLPVDDGPEARERRLATAIETFEALCPRDPEEARLAVQIVLCGAHAAERLREAGVHRGDFAKMTRCRAQATKMMREERAAKRTLARQQNARLAAFTASPQAEPQNAPPSPEAVAQAEAFMQQNGAAAAQIRHDRGVTPRNQAYLRHLTLPTDPTVIDALVRGTSDLLILLDEVGGEDLGAAA